MSDEQVDELLEMTKFTESQKKSGLYIQFLTFERIVDARNSSTELGNYLSPKGILMPLELKSHHGRALIAHKLPGTIFDSHVKVEALRPLLDEIESMIQKRLASHAKSFNV